MILRAILVKSFGVLNPGAELNNLSDGITVVHGPNEAGKSSLLRALSYALYQRHKLGGEEVEADLQPAGTSLAPEVEVELEIGDTRWRIFKRFLKRQESRLEEWNGERFVPQHDGDQADAALAERLAAEFAGRGKSKPEHRGIGQVLIGEHADLRSVHELGQRARTSLRDILGAVATTAEAHDLAALVRKRLDELFTPGGKPKESSRQQRLVDRIEDLEEQLRKVKADVESARKLEEGLEKSESKESEAEAKRSELHRDVERARADEARRAKVAIKLELASAARTAASTTLDERKDAERRIIQLRGELDSTQTALKEHDRDVKDAEERVRAAEKDRADVQQERTNTQQQRSEINAKSQEADDAERAVRCIQRIADLEQRVGDYLSTRAERDERDEALLVTPRPTAEEIRELRRVHREIEKLSTKLQDFSVRAHLQALQDLTITGPTGKVEVSARKSVELSGRSPLEIRIEGVAKVSIHGPVTEDENDLAIKLEQHWVEFRELAERFGSDDLVKLESLATERAKIEQKRDTLDAKLAGLFGTSATAKKAEQELAEARTELEAICSRRLPWRDDPPTLTLANQLRASAKRESDLQERTLERLQRQLETIEGDHKKGLLARDTAKERLQQRQIKRAELESALGELTRGGSDNDRAKEIDRLSAELLSREEEHGLLAVELDPIEHAAQALDAAERAEREFEGLRQQALLARNSDQTRLDDLRASGLYSRLGTLEEELSEKRAAIDHETRRAEGLKRLAHLFDEEQRRSVERLIKPITDKVRRMGNAVLRKDLRPELDDELATTAVALDENRFSLAHLSDGTQDQIAVLTRIALAELYAEKYGRCVLVLDDPLTRSDSERRSRMLDVFTRASKQLQLLIFSCREEDYLRLEATRIRLDVGN